MCAGLASYNIASLELYFEEQRGPLGHHQPIPEPDELRNAPRNKEGLLSCAETSRRQDMWRSEPMILFVFCR